MRVKNKTPLVWAVLLSLVFLFIRFRSTDEGAVGIADEPSFEQVTFEGLIEPDWSEIDFVYEGISKVENSGNDFSGLVAGAIVPHHLLASEMIANVFDILSSRQPGTIILVGPNHYEKGESKVLTSYKGWLTPFGVVEAGDEVLDELMETGMLGIDDDVLTGEHSVFGILPFIEYYLPESKIVPLVLSNTLNINEIEKLAEYLSTLVKDDIVIVASVDFSHYLKESDASANDMHTMEIISNFDIGRILELGDDHLDSPASIALLLSTMRQTGHENVLLVDHTNSSNILRDEFVETTSYMTMFFTRE